VDKLGNILPRVIARQPDGPRLTELRIETAFRELLGPELGAACHEITVDRGCLWITTPNVALGHQLRHDAERLIERLNDEGQVPRRIRRLQVRISCP
jgi:Dna[CI] antecedent DciA-like protein